MSTTVKLKISKRMAELLAEAFPFGDTPKKIAAEVEAGRVDKAGAVMIEATSSDAALLHGYALGSMGKLDADLAAYGEGPEKHKMLGAHSAWRALLRQVAPPA